jgi:hypothetical protein
MKDLLKRQQHHALLPTSCRLRYSKLLDIGSIEPVLLFVDLEPAFLLLLRLVVARINDEVVLALDLRALHHIKLSAASKLTVFWALS